MRKYRKKSLFFYNSKINYICGNYLCKFVIITIKKLYDSSDFYYSD